MFSASERNRKRSVPTRTKYSRLLMAKCSKTNKVFCIRYDRKADEQIWHLAYAFPFSDSMKNEVFTSPTTDSITFGANTPEYKGCLYCGNTPLNFCSCGVPFCADGDGTGWRTCPSCGQSANYSHGTNFKVKSTAY